jgi:uncharacterized protein YeaO (DUF488 family)
MAVDFRVERIDERASGNDGARVPLDRARSRDVGKVAAASTLCAAIAGTRGHPCA